MRKIIGHSRLTSSLPAAVHMPCMMIDIHDVTWVPVGRIEPLASEHDTSYSSYHPAIAFVTNPRPQVDFSTFRDFSTYRLRDFSTFRLVAAEKGTDYFSAFGPPSFY